MASATRETVHKEPYWTAYLVARLSGYRRDLLIRYTGISADDFVSHLSTICDKAWAIRPLPCIGLGLFLRLRIDLAPAYRLIVSKMAKSDALLVDIGCLLGQDLRGLVNDGVDSTKLIGVDLVNFWHLGFEMFRDEKHFQARFIQADILHPSTELQQMQGNVVWIARVLH